MLDAGPDVRAVGPEDRRGVEGRPRGPDAGVQVGHVLPVGVHGVLVLGLVGDDRAAPGDLVRRDVLVDVADPVLVGGGVGGMILPVVIGQAFEKIGPSAMMFIVLSVVILDLIALIAFTRTSSKQTLSALESA